MAEDHGITEDERAMLGEDVVEEGDGRTHPQQEKAARTAPVVEGKRLEAAAASAAAEADEADDDFEKAKQEIDGMDDPDEEEKLDGLQQIISDSTSAAAAASSAAASEASKAPDATSVYVGQVDYDATPNELQSHFEACGTINRVTILCDKFSGRPKGYAYIEFADGEGAINALSLDNSPFKGRNLKVTPKRTNVPGLNVRGRGRGRGRGAAAYYPVPVFPTYRGRGKGRGGYRGAFRGGYRGGYQHGGYY